MWVPTLGVSFHMWVPHVWSTSWQQYLFTNLSLIGYRYLARILHQPGRSIDLFDNAELESCSKCTELGIIYFVKLSTIPIIMPFIFTLISTFCWLLELDYGANPIILYFWLCVTTSVMSPTGISYILYIMFIPLSYSLLRDVIMLSTLDSVIYLERSMFAIFNTFM